MSFTDYLENAVLGHVFGSATYTKPTLYLGLFTAAPGETGGGTEVSGGSYARQATGAMTISGTAPTQAANGSVIEFPAATADWGNITHAAIFDAASGGNMLATAALATARNIQSGDILRVPAGAAVVTLD